MTVTKIISFLNAGSLGSRRWSSLAKWKLRELNELPHYVQHRFVCVLHTCADFIVWCMHTHGSGLMVDEHPPHAVCSAMEGHCLCLRLWVC